MTATHGHPHNVKACGQRLAFRRTTPAERLLDLGIGGYLFTCPTHGAIYMEVFVS